MSRFAGVLIDLVLLYFRFGSGIRGSEWCHGALGALEHNGDIVTSLKSSGLRWGGKIEGNQKDFVHFSPAGY